MYLILKESNCPLFLADRNKTKSFWWTYKICYAMIYNNIEAAKRKRDSLKYGEIKVISLETAKTIRERADIKHAAELSSRDHVFDIEDSFHPYDSYSLGQE